MNINALTHRFSKVVYTVTRREDVGGCDQGARADIGHVVPDSRIEFIPKF